MALDKEVTAAIHHEQVLLRTRLVPLSEKDKLHLLPEKTNGHYLFLLLFTTVT
jgi:hypothetical protein